MKLTTPELIEQYFYTIAEEYPELTMEECKEICHSPWKYLKVQIESGDLPEVRLKYFGTFQVYEGRARNMLFNLKERFRAKNVEPKQYFKLKTMIENYLKRIDNGQQ